MPENDYSEVRLTPDILKALGFKETNEYKGTVYKMALSNDETIVVALSENRTDSLRVDHLTKGKDTYTSMTVSNLSVLHLLKAFDLVGISFKIPTGTVF